MKDVYSGRIVEYTVDSRMKSLLAVAALENAVRARRPAGTVIHSARTPISGCAASLERSGSMGGVDVCADIAAIGSFFSVLAEQRPGPPAMARQAGFPACHHDLDRTDLLPPVTAKAAGKSHANVYETINRAVLAAF